MIELTINHFSESFDTDMQINIMIKNHKSKEPARILYLLHGYNGNFHSWLRGSRIFSYLKTLPITYPLYVIMPSAMNTYYLDIFPRLQGNSYIMEELPAFIQDLLPQCTHTPEYTNIAGLSMGGYGALLAGLSYPKRFKHIASFSGAIDIARRFKQFHYTMDTARFGKESKSIQDFTDTDVDLFYLASQLASSLASSLASGLAEEEKLFSHITLYCGTNDFLIDENRKFNEHLQALNFDFIYEEQEGYEHNWEHWDLCIKTWLPIAFQ